MEASTVITVPANASDDEADRIVLRAVLGEWVLPAASLDQRARERAWKLMESGHLAFHDATGKDYGIRPKGLTRLVELDRDLLFEVHKALACMRHLQAVQEIDSTP